MDFLHTLPDIVKVAVGAVIGAGFLGIVLGFFLYKAGDGFKAWSGVLDTSSKGFMDKFSDIAELSKRISAQETVLATLAKLPAQIEHLKFVTETAIDVAKQHGEEMNIVREDMSRMERISLGRIENIEKNVSEQLSLLLNKVLELAK